MSFISEEQAKLNQMGQESQPMIRRPMPNNWQQYAYPMQPRGMMSMQGMPQGQPMQGDMQQPPQDINRMQNYYDPRGPYGGQIRNVAFGFNAPQRPMPMPWQSQQTQPVPQPQAPQRPMPQGEGKGILSKPPQMQSNGMQRVSAGVYRDAKGKLVRG